MELLPALGETEINCDVSTLVTPSASWTSIICRTASDRCWVGVVRVVANWDALSAANSTASRGEFLIWPIVKVTALLGAACAVLLLVGAFAVRFKNRRRIAVHKASRAKLAALAKAGKEKDRED